MSQQSLDLRTSLRIARRYRFLIGGLAALGLIAGASYAVISPPKATAETLVVIPQLTTSSASAVTNDGTLVTSGTETQVLIAGSDPVLKAALADITPTMTLEQLRLAVQVSNPAGAIIAIDGKSTNGAQAISIANAVAQSYVAFVTKPGTPAGRVNASLLQPANTSTGDNLVEGMLPGALIGVIAGLLIGFITALARGRGERRLRERGSMANAVGVPVLAAVPVMHPADSNDWVKLLDEYNPSPVHAWQFQKMLRHLRVQHMSGEGERGVALSVAVLTLPSDKRALALGPQLAAFAASMGIRTVLAVEKGQDSPVTATLSAAVTAPPEAARRRERPLRTVVVDNREIAGVRDAELVILVIVSAGDAPQLPDTLRTDMTLLGVSTNAATAEELARVAMAADAAGRGITGILVADPDDTDKTTGRIPHVGGVQRRLPTRATGIPTEIRR